MYIDTYVVSGLIIVAATCVFLGAVGYYAWRHIQKDIANSEGRH